MAAYGPAWDILALKGVVEAVCAAARTPAPPLCSQHTGCHLPPGALRGYLPWGRQAGHHWRAAPRNGGQLRREAARSRGRAGYGRPVRPPRRHACVPPAAKAPGRHARPCPCDGDGRARGERGRGHPHRGRRCAGKPCPVRCVHRRKRWARAKRALPITLFSARRTAP